ncbi:RNA polymerase sigma factor [Sphingomonas sp.]|uniref:RNA polymerase sigma factor n=1 Tax=Sphingomonas sp. TaxID=28214 RepID=UPI002DD6A4A8|nr:RNA polymerase sigma factor [Sphingomonas sp.]
MEPTSSAKWRRSLDEYCVVAAQAGDRAALAQLAERWHRRLVAHAWRLTGDRDAAHDIVQSAWIDIARGLAQLQDERAFPAWAYRIVTRHAGRRMAQDTGSRQRLAPLDDELADPAPCDGEQAADHASLRAAVAALPAIHRAAVALHYFEELSIAETAVALGIPANTVKTRIFHARRALRTKFEGGQDA